MTSISEEVLHLIKSIITDENRILLNQADLYSYSYDASFGTYLPDLVLQPISTEEVAKIVCLANDYKIPVYPRGDRKSVV